MVVFQHLSVWIPGVSSIASWWFQPIWKILVKLGIIPNFRGENQKYLSCLQADSNPRWFGLQTKRVKKGDYIERATAWANAGGSWISFEDQDRTYPFRGREASQQTTQMEPWSFSKWMKQTRSLINHGTFLPESNSGIFYKHWLMGCCGAVVELKFCWNFKCGILQNAVIPPKFQLQAAM